MCPALDTSLKKKKKLDDCLQTLLQVWKLHPEENHAHKLNFLIKTKVSKCSDNVTNFSVSVVHSQEVPRRIG